MNSNKKATAGLNKTKHKGMEVRARTKMNISFQADNKQQSDSTLRSSIQDQAQNSWLSSVRLNSFERYASSALPTRKIEHWKYNDMYFLSQSEYQLDDLKQEQSDINTLVTNSIEIRLTGNDSSTITNAHDALTITPFCKTSNAQQKLILENFESTQQNKNLLVNLNNALASNGLLIEIAPGATIDQPINIIQTSHSIDSSSVSCNQIIVHCGESSHCQIVEQFTSTADNTSDLMLQQTIISLANNSQCNHHRLNLESSKVRQVSRSVTRLAKNSSYKGFYFSKGSLLNKTDIDIFHQGEHSASELTGIYLPSGEDCVDYHTNIEHQVANCISREIFRGIIADSAKVTFNGKIHIFKYAQKSDAQLNNKNLLLTNTAEVNTKPELEIYADDVICAHGATVAKIDEQAIYYMQTRGIKTKDARRMLSHGFINELLDKIDNDAIKESIRTIVLDALASSNS
ncbi:MAG: Fe-S cluster assembly protein SufD [Kangiellaceae bacterium]|nr:Fe-S cluster assembly protein SufD [Kangiellaceae bacterium]